MLFLANIQNIKDDNDDDQCNDDDSNLGVRMRVPVLVLSCLVPSIMSYFADWSLLAR